jgi:g-D-glutamyl-meso-diaminopimelate peptidase
MNYLEIMTKRYGRYISFSYCGESILGRGIPEISLGEGEKEIVYIGSHDGRDVLSAVILLRFINEYCEVLNFDGRLYNYSIKYLFGTRRIRIIPMPNPDGTDICINGVSPDNILADRLLSMNNEKDKKDFSNWGANARGVDLEKNYKCTYVKSNIKFEGDFLNKEAGGRFCGEYPESEPEIGSMCNAMRFRKPPMAALCLEGSGKQILYSAGNTLPRRCKSIGEALSRMSGFQLKSGDAEREVGGFVEFCTEELGIPAYKISYIDTCKTGNREEYFEYYARLREILFTLPAIV